MHTRSAGHPAEHDAPFRVAARAEGARVRVSPPTPPATVPSPVVAPVRLRRVTSQATGMSPGVAEAGSPGVAALVHVAGAPAPLAPRVPPLEGARGARRPLRLLQRAPRPAPTPGLLGATGLHATSGAPALLRPAGQRVGGVREPTTASAVPLAATLEVP